MEALNIGVLMDPIQNIKPAKDTTLALMLAAQRLGHKLHYMEAGDVHMNLDHVYTHSRTIEVSDKEKDFYALGESRAHSLDELDVLLMRVDPPFDMSYIFATYLLERAQRLYSTTVVNEPASLRSWNEKLLALEFRQYCAPLVISEDIAEINSFIKEYQDVIVKPLDKMGGQSIYRVKHGEENIASLLEGMLAEGLPIMAQRYIPEITEGDKRILLIDGKPVDMALARIPAPGEVRANLAAGGTGKAQPLSERDREICAAVGPRMAELGLVFVGLDVIGDFLTEVNITSPTGVRELERAGVTHISEDIIKASIRRMQT